MLTLHEFSELRCLWLIFTQDVESCYRYTEKDGKRWLRCHNRAIAVERALNCLIATHPEAIFYAFVCPTVSLQHVRALA